ncbi:hypothetical protein [Staphylococcus sp. LKG3-3]|uniref:hypothetical protein n=1 Tax=Staphylococcus sp. LKG3-3 TaxID=3399685 RepID=UPI003D5A134A
MNTIEIYSKDDVLCGYSYHIDRIDIQPLNGGYIKYIEHFPGGTLSNKIEPLKQCKLYQEEKMCIVSGVPAFKDDGKYYHLPKQCYEIYEGKEQTPKTLKELSEE